MRNWASGRLLAGACGRSAAAAPGTSSWCLCFAAPLLRRPGVSPWTGEAEDQVLQHACGARRVLDVGRWAAAVVRLGLGFHLLGQLELFAFGTFVERLAERFTVIRYDKPGCGLSGGDGIDLSFDGQVAAALAVADAVGAGRFGMFGASQGGQLAAAIAAGYPDRVDALVLYGMCASGSDLAPAEVRDSVVALVRAHWGLGLKALAGAFVTDPTAEELAGFTRFQRASAPAAKLRDAVTKVRALLAGQAAQLDQVPGRALAPTPAEHL